MHGHHLPKYDCHISKLLQPVSTSIYTEWSRRLQNVAGGMPHLVFILPPLRDIIDIPRL